MLYIWHPSDFVPWLSLFLRGYLPVVSVPIAWRRPFCHRRLPYVGIANRSAHKRFTYLTSYPSGLERDPVLTFKDIAVCSCTASVFAGMMLDFSLESSQLMCAAVTVRLSFFYSDFSTFAPLFQMLRSISTHLVFSFRLPLAI